MAKSLKSVLVGILFAMAAGCEAEDDQVRSSKTSMETTATLATTSKPTPKPSPTPASTLTPTPKPSPTPATQQRAKPVGVSSGTTSGDAMALHNQPFRNWKNASDEARSKVLVTMTEAIFKDAGPQDVLLRAVELEACMGELVESAPMQNSKVVEVAVLCAVTLGWKQE